MKWRLPAAALFFIGALAILRPWTVRPLDEAAATGAFDADVYVATIWPSRVMAEAARAADVSTVTADALPGDRKSALVAGTGVVTAVDTTSRAGIARVRLGDRTVDVQIGPVIRGTAIRDALPFVSFSDFANQIDYAKVASALNTRVLEGPLKAIDAASLRGRQIRVVGALTVAGGRAELTPISFELVENPK